jgi:hypothetical protein
MSPASVGRNKPESDRSGNPVNLIDLVMVTISSYTAASIQNDVLAGLAKAKSGIETV